MKKNLILVGLLLVSAAYSAMVFHGLTLVSNGVVDFSKGAITTPFHVTAADPTTCTTNDFWWNTTSQQIKTCIGGKAAAIAGPIFSFSLAFTNQTSVTLTHNLNTTSVVVECWDSSTAPGNLVVPANVQIVDANNVTVTFASAQSGMCVVL